MDWAPPWRGVVWDAGDEARDLVTTTGTDSWYTVGFAALRLRRRRKTINPPISANPRTPPTIPPTIAPVFTFPGGGAGLTPPPVLSLPLLLLLLLLLGMEVVIVPTALTRRNVAVPVIDDVGVDGVGVSDNDGPESRSIFGITAGGPVVLCEITPGTIAKPQRAAEITENLIESKIRRLYYKVLGRGAMMGRGEVEINRVIEWYRSKRLARGVE